MVVANTTTATDNDKSLLLFDRKIAIACEGLRSHYHDLFYKIPLKENALTLASYVISMKSEIKRHTMLQGTKSALTREAKAKSKSV